MHYRRSKKNTELKEPDAPKIDTKMLSLELFEQGLNISQIADKRDMVVSTIEGHLAHFVARGELAIDSLLPPERQQTVEQKLLQMPNSKFSEVKLALGGDYSYGEIKLVQAHLQYQAKDQGKDKEAVRE